MARCTSPIMARTWRIGRSSRRRTGKSSGGVIETSQRTWIPPRAILAPDVSHKARIKLRLSAALENRTFLLCIR